MHFAGYADDNTPYRVQKNTRRKVVSKPLTEYFRYNKMKLNLDKHNLILSNSDIKAVNVGNFTIKSSKGENLLGVSFDNKTNCQSHIENLLSKAKRKLHALACIAPHMDLRETRILINVLFDSQFNYCQLVLMCDSRTLNKK